MRLRGHFVASVVAMTGRSKAMLTKRTKGQYDSALSTKGLCRSGASFSLPALALLQHVSGRRPAHKKDSPEPRQEVVRRHRFRPALVFGPATERGPDRLARLHLRGDVSMKPGIDGYKVCSGNHARNAASPGRRLALTPRRRSQNQWLLCLQASGLRFGQPRRELAVPSHHNPAAPPPGVGPEDDRKVIARDMVVFVFSRRRMRQGSRASITLDALI